MTVRIDQLVMTGDAEGNLGNPTDKQGIAEQEVLALVRHIMRERNDCQMIPVVNEVFKTLTRNEFGDHIFIDVTYSKSGWRATYGARYDESGVLHVQCYMD